MNINKYIEKQSLGRLIEVSNEIYDWKTFGILPEFAELHVMAEESDYDERYLEERIVSYLANKLEKTVLLLFTEYPNHFLTRSKEGG